MKDLRNSDYVLDHFHFFSFIPEEKKVFLSDSSSLDSALEHFHAVFKSYFPPSNTKSIFSGSWIGKLYLFDDLNVFAYIDRDSSFFNVEIASENIKSEGFIDMFKVVNNYFSSNGYFDSDFDKRQSILLKKNYIKGNTDYDKFFWRSGLNIKLNPEIKYSSLEDVA
ncbi:hypothetical protein K9L67_01545 [Candidatus Woesearchaeota archaeon]|nr:hypothetical protein [Candidatus Woesearchaeota archaeon]MCF7900887.1 hypothetical protein [Candidatus Woesearchaeota archaeon]MCF8013064.1 hypothetical protein [Candidatus Woesearchaeota archaeon]